MTFVYANSFVATRDPEPLRSSAFHFSVVSQLSFRLTLHTNVRRTVDSPYDLGSLEYFIFDKGKIDRLLAGLVYIRC